MAKSEPTPYVSVQDKIAALEASKANLQASLESAPEDQKAGLNEQINDADRKIRWYQGRMKSAKFQAKAAAAPTPVTPEPSSDPRNG